VKLKRAAKRLLFRYGNRKCGAPEGELGVGLMGLDAFSCECC
jgi:hypothetical protein